MNRCLLVVSVMGLAGVAFAGTAHAGPATACTVGALNTKTVTHEVGFVNGRLADTFLWYDSKCLPRTVSLLRQVLGANYNGGFAWQMTYQVQGAIGAAKTVTVSADTSLGEGGFGYFVSHERYRYFADGDTNTIAGKIFGVDDSPLGFDFPVTTQAISLPAAAAAAYRVRTTYHHYGTTSPHTLDPDTGNDVPPLPTDPGSYANYPLPVTMTWVFQHGTDYPRIDISMSLANVPQANLLSFDMRGPYGVVIFDNGANGTVTGMEMANHYKFIITQNPPTRASSWTWNTPNTGARFSSMVAGTYEMGLFENVAIANSTTGDNYSAPWIGSTFALAGACSDGSENLPCDGIWPYQGIQYSLPDLQNPASNTQPTAYKKMAWGTAAFYGMNLTSVDDGAETENFNGFPTSGIVGYSLCLVLGKTTANGLTATAAATPTQNCATATAP